LRRPKKPASEYNFLTSRDEEENMMAKQIPVSTRRVELKKSPRYAVVPATGAWISKAMNGDLLCNFLYESEELPEIVTLGLTASDKVISEEEREFKNGKEHGSTKEIMVGIALPLEVAESVGKMLIDAARRHKSKSTRG
jgi:hypothetical protein